MSAEWIIRVVLFGIVHWVLAGMMIQDLAHRERVFGRHKPPWAVTIILVPCFGSLFYLFFHPQILNPDHSRHEADRRKGKK